MEIAAAGVHGVPGVDMLKLSTWPRDAVRPTICNGDVWGESGAACVDGEIAVALY